MMDKVSDVAFNHVSSKGCIHSYRRGSVVALYNSVNLAAAFVRDVPAGEPFNMQLHLPDGDQMRLREMGLDADSVRMEAPKVLAELQGRAVNEGIRTLYLLPIMICNYRCKYCQFIQEFDDNMKVSRMTVNQARALVDEFYVMAASTPAEKRDLVFFGGEPFLAPDIVKAVLKYIRDERKDHEMNIIAFTNASMITDEMAVDCGRYGLYPIVSMDGGAIVNDRARVDLMGRGCFDKTAKGYRKLKAAGCKIGISVMVGRHNVDSLRASVEWLLDEFEPDEIGITGVFHPLKNTKNPFQANANEVVDALVETYTACRERGVYVDQVARRLRPFVAMRPKLKDCMACGGKVIATPEGMEGHCEYIAYRKQSQTDRLVHLDRNDWRDWIKRSPVLKRDCQNCPALGICGGGCPYNAYQLHGDLDALDEENCDQTRSLLAWMLDDLANICVGRGERDSGPVIYPSRADREALFGEIDVHDDTLPMRSVSTHGE